MKNTKNKTIRKEKRKIRGHQQWIYMFSRYVRKNERDDEWYIIGNDDWERGGDHGSWDFKSIMLGVFFLIHFMSYCDKKIWIIT